MIVNIQTYTDTDYVQSFIYQTQDGDPIDISNKSLHMMARKNAADATAVFEVSTINGLITVTDGLGGAFTILIPIDTLQHTALDTYQQSLIMVDNITLLREDIWRGTLIHSAGPTRWTLGEL